MPDDDDDLFGHYHPEKAGMQELQEFREALLGRIGEIIEQHEIADDLVPLLLAEIAVTFRVTAYGVAAEKPSASGLKLDLDRFRRDIDEMIRVMKKGAEEFVATAKQARAGEAAPED